MEICIIYGLSNFSEWGDAPALGTGDPDSREEREEAMSNTKILAFVCNWCSYGGADNAGGMRLEYPAGVRLVRVMCSGRVEPQMVLEAFRGGADGVMVLGCHPGDCHYKEGNLNAQKRMLLLHAMLDQYGIDRRRFRLDWVSASEGQRFVEVVTEMHDRVQGLGPLALPERDARLRPAKEVAV